PHSRAPPSHLFSTTLPHPPPSTLFPYTTLFRSLPPQSLYPASFYAFNLLRSDSDYMCCRNHRLGRRATIAPEVVHQPLIAAAHVDRKSTRLNSSHRTISYAVFCLKKKKKK